MSSQVAGILITHWHIDHINGASILLKACTSAKLFCSGALSSSSAMNIASLYKKDIFSNVDKEISEFGKIIKYLVETKAHERLVPVNIRHTFFHDKHIPMDLIALSPSDVDVTQSISKLAKLLPKDDSERVRNVVPEDENLNAVALHFSFGNFSAVLGSDLEKRKNSKTGWSAVFHNNIISDLSLGTADLYKVSHHGSETGYHEKIWQDLLVMRPISITTPYSRSKLPKPAGIKKIKDLSSDFYITTDPQSNKKIKRDNMVERKIRSMTKSRRVINNKMGHIQIRITANGDIQVSGNENVVKYSSSIKS